MAPSCFLVFKDLCRSLYVFICCFLAPCSDGAASGSVATSFTCDFTSFLLVLYLKLQNSCGFTPSQARQFGFVYSSVQNLSYPLLNLKLSFHFSQCEALPVYPHSVLDLSQLQMNLSILKFWKKGPDVSWDSAALGTVTTCVLSICSSWTGTPTPCPPQPPWGFTAESQPCLLDFHVNTSFFVDVFYRWFFIIIF